MRDKRFDECANYRNVFFRTYLVVVCMPLYVGARAEGVSSIEEGRIFLLREDFYRERDLVPTPLEKEHVTHGNERCEIRIASSTMPVACPECRGIFEHSLVQHDYHWMQMAFYCPKHPLSVWLDIFPKADGPDTGWDKTNMLPRRVTKDIEIDDQRLVIDGLIGNAMTARERYRDHVRNVKVVFRLTPQGIKKVSMLPWNSSASLGTLAKIKKKVVSLFLK